MIVKQQAQTMQKRQLFQHTQCPIFSLVFICSFKWTIGVMQGILNEGMGIISNTAPVFLYVYTVQPSVSDAL